RRGLLRLPGGLGPVLADLARRLAHPVRAGGYGLPPRGRDRAAAALRAGDLPFLQEPALHAAQEPGPLERMEDPSPTPGPHAPAGPGRGDSRPSVRRRRDRPGARLEPAPPAADAAHAPPGPAPPPPRP